jgi:hypothetical protein
MIDMIGRIVRLILSQIRRPPLQGRLDKESVKEYVTPYATPLLEIEAQDHRHKGYCV